MNLKKTILWRVVRTIYQLCERRINYIKRRPYIKNVSDIILQQVSDKIQNCSVGTININDVSIISSNCFAGRIMQDVKMEYNSPTLGLYFMYPDYIEFLSHLEFYLTEAKIQFVEKSKYPLGNQRREKRSLWYPIGLLNGKVEIHFLHYRTEEEAAEKWYRRARRVNFDNLFIIGMQQNLCTEEDIINFDALPFENKIRFSTLPLPLKSNEYMPEYSNQGNVGDAYSDGHIFYRHLICHFKNKLHRRI